MAGDLANCSFSNYNGKHAIKITSAGTYNFNSVIFDQSGTNDIETTHTSGEVVINITGGGTVPTVTKTGAGTYSVNVTANFDFTLNPSITGYEWRIYTVTAEGSMVGASEIDGEETATLDNQSITHSYTNQPIAVQIIDDNYVESITYYTLTTADLSITINLVIDDND